MAPLLLTRALLPALAEGGRVQITSGGLPMDTMKIDDLEAKSIPVGIGAYSHSKHVLEAMAISLSREIAPIPVNVVGGALPGATNMTKVITFNDMPVLLKVFYPIVKFIMLKEDCGKSAKTCAAPVVWAVETPADRYYQGKFKKAVASEENQAIVMKYIESKIVKTFQ